MTDCFTDPTDEEHEPDRNDGASARTRAGEARVGDAGRPARSAASARSVWRTYFEASQRLSHALEQQLKSECGMSLGDYNVLLLLVNAPDGSLRLGELARQMVFSPSRLTYQAGTLEKRGLITRFVCDDDRRGVIARITDEGRRTFRRAAAVHARQVDELFLSDLDDAQLTTLDEVFGAVSRRLDQHGG